MLPVPKLSCNTFHYGIFYDFRITLPSCNFLPPELISMCVSKP